MSRVILLKMTAKEGGPYIAYGLTASSASPDSVGICIGSKLTILHWANVLCFFIADQSAVNVSFRPNQETSLAIKVPVDPKPFVD